ncbi:MAG: hypothetical protein K6A92_11390 [Lachnospiraceae bacterium]|nr:hypothetical protein [Lachnospiraceae bacterium]
MEDKLAGVMETIEKYRADVQKMDRYITYLSSKRDQAVMQNYEGDSTGGPSTVMHFPVYDSGLMTFVKEAQNTVFMDRNYPYVYSRYRIKGVEDERRLIEQADVKTFDVLCGILSRYVLLGQRRSSVWADGVKEGIFLDIILKMQSIITYWDTTFEK